MTRRLLCTLLVAGAVTSGQGRAPSAATVDGRLQFSGGQARLRHPGYEASFEHDGWVTWRPAFDRSGTLVWRYQLQALISGLSVTAVEAVPPRAIGGGVEYRRHDVIERYVARDSGIEQVFEITQPTPDGLRLRGRMPVPPGAVAAVVDGGVVVGRRDGRALTYSKPVAFDGNHAPLAVRVELSAETLDLVIDAADLEGRRLPITIDPLVSAPQQLTTGYPDDVRVAHDSLSGDLLVVYRELGGVFGQRLTASAVPAEPAFELCNWCDEPRVAFGNQHFLVTWRSTLDDQIYGRFVLRGSPEPYGFVEISQATESSGRHAEIAATNDGFIVAWIGRDVSTSGIDRVRTRRVRPLSSRGPIHSVDVTGTGSALNDFNPGVAYDPFRDRALVTYANGGRVYGSWVGTTGLIGFPGQISASGGASTVSTAFDHVSRRYLVVWTEPVRAALLDDGLGKISEFPIVVRDPAPSHLRVDVVAESGGFMLTYSDRGATYAPYNYPVDLAHRLVTAAGVVTDLGLLTTDGANAEDSSASMAVGEAGYGMLAFAKRRYMPVGGVFVAPTARPAPRIATQPQGALVASAGTAQLTVTTVGGPYSFQWYTGYRSPLDQPIAGATGSSYTTPPLAADASYWVRVTNVNGISTDSRPATVTVATPPTITQSPWSQTVAFGQSAVLAVAASGTLPLGIQWYRGPTGVTTAPIPGAIAGSYVTPPLTSTTSYWARVTNAYGSADSAAALITVAPGTPTSVGDAYSTAFNTPLTVPAPGVLANDLANGNGTLTAALVATAASGALSFGADGGFTYTPNPGFVGTDSFTYRALGTGGAGLAATVTLTVSPATAPQPPSGLNVASVVGSLVTLRWTPPAAGPVPTGYILHGGVRPGETLAVVPTGSAAPIFSFTAPAGSFFVRMLTVTNAGPSAPSNDVPLYVSVPVTPSPPSALTGLATGHTLDLAWKNTFGGGPPTGLTLDVTGAIAVSVALPVTERFSFPGVPPGTYTFRLRATNGGGSSAASAPVTLTFPGTCTPPGPPLSVLAYHVGRTLSIVWDPPATGAAPTGYVLGVVSTVFTGDLALAARSFSAGAPPGSYTFAVRSANPCGTSAPSAPQTVTIP